MAKRAAIRGRRSKYGAVRTTVDGITFHSQREAERYAELRLMEKAGEIADLELQPVYDIHVPRMWHPDCEPTPVARYVADFRYSLPTGEQIVEDSKGFRTPTYKLKRRLVQAQYGITITEV